MEFKEVLLGFKLTDESVDTIIMNGITSVEELRLMNDELVQKHFSKKLTLGQVLLLSDTVKKLQTCPASMNGLDGTSMSTEEDIQVITSQGNEGRGKVRDLFNRLPEDAASTKPKQISVFVDAAPQRHPKRVLR